MHTCLWIWKSALHVRYKLSATVHRQKVSHPPQESQLSPVFPESRAHKQYASRLATFRDAHRKQAVPVDDGRFKRAEHERAHREFF